MASSHQMDFFSSKPQIQESTTNQSENSQSPIAHAIGRRFTGPRADPATATAAAATAAAAAAATAAAAAAAAAILTPALNRLPAQPPQQPQMTLPHRSLVTPGLPGPPADLPALPIPSAASSLGIPGIPGIPVAGPRRIQHAPAPDAAEYIQLSPSQLAPLLSRPSPSSTLIVDIRPFAQFLSSRLPNAVSLNVPSILLKRPSTDWNKITATITDPAALERFSRWSDAATLLILDTDTTVLAEPNNLLGLLRKFRIAGYSGNLSWVKGGMTAIYKEARSIVETGVIPIPSTDDSSPTSAISASRPSPPAPERLLCPRDLPIQAFQGSSTTMLGQPKPTPSRDKTTLSAANPFYDNIRQNFELANGVGDKIQLHLSDHVFARRDDLPFQWLRDLVHQAESPDHGAETLAMQFYRIEVGEQRRLLGIMNHHTCHSDDTRPFDPPSASPTQFPFSITAGIEMGTKNRYRNIWPFEHARVRLRTTSGVDGSDYVNASYVQPMVTKRRYIATQGPLATTFNDFWAIVWEQNIPVIVMLTREVEGNHVKSDCYWKDGQYGHLQIKLEEQVGATDVASISLEPGGFNFGSITDTETASDAIIRRVFTLRNLQQPDAAPRKIVHLQYLGWPDLNVPESSRGILDLIKHVNNALANASSSPREDPEPGPIMLHCSAGVGRTGGFIVVDAILDGIRREMRSVVQGLSSGNNDMGTSSDAMDIDEPEIPSPPIARHGGSDSMRNPPKSSSSGTGSSNKQQRLYPALAEKLVNTSVASNPPLSNSATINAWSANLPSPSSEYASSGNGNGNRSSNGSAKGSESKPSSNSPSPPGFHGDENDIYFKVPRKLHRTGSPPLLSTLHQPIREVLEDMREQRMSLCQSLRQYVFAHRVILEGALEIVDEEKAFFRQHQLERVDEGKRADQPWDALQHRDGHRHRESTSSSSLRPGSHPKNFWSSTSSISSLPDETGSSAAPSSAARQSDPNVTFPSLSSSLSSRPAQMHLESTSPPVTTNPLTSPMKNLSIDLSSSPSRPMAGKLSEGRPRTPGSVAIRLPPPALTGKRSHSPSRWGRKRSVEQENDETLTVDEPHVAERPSIKRKLRSDDTVDVSTTPRSKFGAGAGMTALDR